MGTEDKEEWPQEGQGFLTQGAVPNVWEDSKQSCPEVETGKGREEEGERDCGKEKAKRQTVPCSFHHFIGMCDWGGEAKWRMAL